MTQPATEWELTETETEFIIWWYSTIRTLVARIRADGEQITELKRRADAAEARAARLAEALQFYAEGWPLGVEWDGGDHARVVLSALRAK